MSEFVTRHELAQREALWQSQLGTIKDGLTRVTRLKPEAVAEVIEPIVDRETLRSIAKEEAVRVLATMRLPKDGVSVRGDVGPKGEQGPRGPIGPIPKHEWNGTELRFEQAPGQWGKYVDLQGPAGKDGRTHTSFSVVNEGGGSGGTSDGSVPLYIAPGETYVVPSNRQALFRLSIRVSGYIRIQRGGYLVAVS